jgi:hypothetical protein
MDSLECYLMTIDLLGVIVKKRVKQTAGEVAFAWRLVPLWWREHASCHR